MKVTVHFKGPDTSNDMVFTRVTEASRPEHTPTLNIRHREGGENVLSRIPIENVSHWTVVEKE